MLGVIKLRCLYAAHMLLPRFMAWHVPRLAPATATALAALFVK